MNYRRNRIRFVTLLLAAFLIVPVVAQDTPVPTAEATPPPVVETTTTTTTSPVENIGLTLTWALAFLALWQAAGVAYAVTVEKTIKPVLYGAVGTFTQDERVRHAVLVAAVFVGAFYAVQTGGINLFADAPFGLFDTASPAFLLVLNALFVAAGAFMGHELWQTLETWLKKAKAVTEVIAPPVTAEAQLVQAESDLSRIPAQELVNALKRRGGYIVTPSKQYKPDDFT